MGLDAVADRVFQQGLQHQGGQARLAGGVVHAPVHVEALAQSQGFQVQIGPRQFQFPAQSGELAVVRHEAAIQLGQVFQGGFRPAGIGAHQGQHAVEGVEQEMGPDAGLQGLEPRLRQGGGQPAGAPVEPGQDGPGGQAGQQDGARQPAVGKIRVLPQEERLPEPGDEHGHGQAGGDGPGAGHGRQPGGRQEKDQQAGQQGRFQVGGMSEKRADRPAQPRGGNQRRRQAQDLGGQGHAQQDAEIAEIRQGGRVLLCHNSHLTETPRPLAIPP